MPNVWPDAHPVRRFCDVFAKLDPARPMDLASVYASGIVFDDPFHHIEGRAALEAYFARLNANLVGATFTFGEAIAQPGRAFLPWTMRLRARQIPKEVVVEGASVLEFDTLVTRQRDHFDGGAMVYEHVPLLGAVVRFIKHRM